MPGPSQERSRGDDGAGRELVQVAYAVDAIEGELIHGLLEQAGIPSLLEQAELNVDGPQLGFALALRGFGGGPQRVMVHANRAEEAHALLAETRVEDDGGLWPESVNAEHLDDAGGGRVRDYNVVGACLRAILLALGVFAVVFLLLRVT